MKMLAVLCLVSLVLEGCASSKTQRDSFAALHNRVQQMLAGRCAVAPIVSDELLGRSFEAHPPNSGCRILVFEREFLTQSEWDRRYVAGTNLFNEFMTMTKTNQHVAARAAERFGALDRLLRLPSWSYERIGVSAHVQCPEVVYPGLEQDSVTAQRLLEEMVTLLKPYQRVDAP